MPRFNLILILLFAAMSIHAAQDTSSPITTHNTPRDFPVISTRAEWEARAKLIREQILVSSGLWPTPEKTPLHAQIFGKIARDGYSVEKVYFQALPGFYVGGNLYRSLGRGNGPFPAVLAPHGHWENGRLVDQKDASYPGLCINFAKQGIIAFSYDMVGYNDTHFADSPTNVPFYKSHRSFETNDPAALLWSVSLMGLQTWDSIRAVDFLASLPDVDTNRLGCTGASGGGTQTMLLGAIDDRVLALAPVVMVSHTMQGGCLCENMPGLRVEFSNMEIAAAAAPRWQIMVGASGDWTKTMMTVEGPAVAHIYDLFHLSENLRYVRFDFPHNYNQTSREAVYQWFDHVLLDKRDAPVKEVAFQKEPDADLRVFPDGKLPPDALTQQQVVDYLINMHRKQLAAMEPKSADSLRSYRQTLVGGYIRTLQLPVVDLGATPEKEATLTKNGFTVERLKMPFIGQAKINVVRFIPEKPNSRQLRIVLVSPEAEKPYVNAASEPIGLARQLLDRSVEVLVLSDLPKDAATNEISIFYNTYNRTRIQQIVARLASVCTFSETLDSMPDSVVLYGDGRAGLWCLLAAPSATAVIADCDQFDVSNDKNLLAPDLFCPGLRNVDTFNGALILAAPHPLLLHNTAGKFPIENLKSTYKILGASNKLRVEKEKLTDEQIADWILKL